MDSVIVKLNCSLCGCEKCTSSIKATLIYGNSFIFPSIYVSVIVGECLQEEFTKYAFDTFMLGRIWQVVCQDNY